MSKNLDPRRLIEVRMPFNRTVTVREIEPGICRSCGAQIVWCRTELDKLMPVDLGEEPMTCHFATCRDASTWRKS